MVIIGAVIIIVWGVTRLRRDERVLIGVIISI